jgi:TM2 domain-containing membrane protein YozV
MATKEAKQMYCSQCGSLNPDSSNFCAACGAALSQGTAQLKNTVAPNYTVNTNSVLVVQGKKYAQGKSPFLALIMSLIIVGLGQFYNGDHKKGALMLIVAVIGGIFTWAILWFAIAIWSAIDAFNVAGQKSPMW